jgi:mRNA interferase MazF
MTRHGMTPRQRDIVLIPEPFTDLTTTKRRSVLVLSKTSHDCTSPDVIVAAITSNLAASGVGLDITSTNLEEGTLPLQSRVRADKIYTLSKTVMLFHEPCAAIECK